MKKTNKKSQKISFEQALYLSLIKNELLLPINEDQVKEFEKRIGNTKMEIPKDLENPDIVFEQENRGEAKILKIEKLDAADELILKVASRKDSPRNEEL